jgi:uncharacterized protein YozE (UPF0346 family)
MNMGSVAGGGHDGGMHMIEQNDDDRQQVAFGRWLLTQRDRGDWVDGIAEAARADRTFPRDGDPEAVRAHLRKQQADFFRPFKRIKASDQDDR